MVAPTFFMDTSQKLTTFLTVCKAPVLLLDECTSALDARTEEIVLRRLQSLPGKTCIAVTHRTAAMDLADWRLEVENGKINAKPSH